MTSTAPDLAIVGNPIAWFVVALLAIAILAPRLLPLVGRTLGRMLGMEVRRRVGLPVRPTGPRPRPPAASGETRVPPAKDPPAATPPDLKAVPDAAPRQPRTASRPVWLSLVVVGAAVVMLLWYLLHAR